MNMAGYRSLMEDACKKQTNHRFIDRKKNSWKSMQDFNRAQSSNLFHLDTRFSRTAGSEVFNSIV